MTHLNAALEGDLTVAQAHEVQARLVAGLEQAAPLSFGQIGRVDLAGVQLLVAYSAACARQGLIAFATDFPKPLRDAFAMAGCLDDAGRLDQEMMR